MAVQKSMDKRDLRWYAISSYASELQDSGKSRLSGNDIQSLIDYEKTEDQLNATEQNILRRIYWRMHYHFDEFESDVEFVRKQWTDPTSIPVQSHIEEKFDESQFSTSRIESMLELGRFLVRKHFNLTDRNVALQFVANLIADESKRRAVIYKLKPINHAEFERLLDRCIQSKTPTEEVYLRLVDIISRILSANQIEIPSDVDDFMLKLATLQNFRDNIFKDIRSEKHRAKIFQLCELLLANELNNSNKGGVKIAG